METFIESIFYKKTNNVFIQLFRYTFVGGFSFLVDFGLLYLLTEYFNYHYLVSAAFAFLTGLIINYFLSIKWVFANRTTKSKRIEFIIFSVIGIIGLILNEILIWYFTDVVNIYYLYSKLLSAMLIYFWNFIIRKLTLFK